MRRRKRNLGRKTINGTSWLSLKFILMCMMAVFALQSEIEVACSFKIRKTEYVMARKSGEIGEGWKNAFPCCP